MLKGKSPGIEEKLRERGRALVLPSLWRPSRMGDDGSYWWGSGGVGVDSVVTATGPRLRLGYAVLAESFGWSN